MRAVIGDMMCGRDTCDQISYHALVSMGSPSKLPRNHFASVLGGLLVDFELLVLVESEMLPSLEGGLDRNHLPSPLSSLCESLGESLVSLVSLGLPLNHLPPALNSESDLVSVSSSEGGSLRGGSLVDLDLLSSSLEDGLRNHLPQVLPHMCQHHLS